MNNRIAAALAVAGSLLLGPAALAAPVAPAPAAGDDLELVRADILDHGQGDQGRDDHDHDGDGRPDHDPEDHEDSEDEPKPKPKDDED